MIIFEFALQHNYFGPPKFEGELGLWMLQNSCASLYFGPYTRHRIRLGTLYYTALHGLH